MSEFDPYLSVLYSMSERELGLLNSLYPPISKKLSRFKVEPVRDSTNNPKIGNNVSCPCGSGKKYKNCCKK